MFKLSGALDFLPQGQSVQCLAFSGDGSLIATAELDGTVKVFDAATLAPRAWITLDKEPLAIRFFPKVGQRLPTLGTATRGQTLGEIIEERHLIQIKDLIADACSRITLQASDGNVCPAAPR